MKNIILISSVLLLCLIFPLDLNNQGHLVIIGGGPRPDYVMDAFIEYAGGEDARIIIFPTASYDPEAAGEFYVDEFNKRGVTHVNYIVCTNETADTDEYFEILRGATGIFFSGGNQNRHTAALLGTKLLDKVKNIYANGGVVGGTSAGAAIMSEVMITGDEYLANEEDEPFSTIKKDNIVISQGFGFLQSVIIDQHFVQRKRYNRLISLVLENPHLVGIGIDEETAIIVYPDNTFKVLGENTVIVMDAQESNHITTDKNNNLTGNNIHLHILKSGTHHNLP